MAHYATLRDYAFTGDADDIRGADLYAADGKIGTVKDVVFDHQTGDIEYLVADVGHDRLALISASHIFRAVADDDAFETDLTSAEVARLPRFDESALEDEKRWERHAGDHDRYWKEREERYEAEFKRKWDVDPVMHMKDSERIITPPDVTSAGGERIITGADLTPRRISPKVAGTAPMRSTSTNETGEDLTLRPTGPDLDAQAKAGSWERSERLQSFQESMRRRIPDLRQRCSVCSGTRRVA